MSDYWQEFVAGSVGGMSGVLAGHPADTVKVRQQALSLTMPGAIHKTLTQEGWRGFFKGLAFPLISAGALNSIYFGVYSTSLRFLDSSLGVVADKERPSYVRLFVAGCVGGVAQLVVATPVDLVKIQLQTQTAGTDWRPHYRSAARGPLGCLVELYRKRGLRGWYHGLGAMAARDVASFGLYIVMYEFMVYETRKRMPLSRPEAAVLAGGAAGVCAWTSCLPIDVVKSRIMADDPARPQYRGMMHCARLTLLRDGPAAFCSGFSMLVIRAFIANAVTFVGYEYTLLALGRVASPSDVEAKETR